MSHFSLGVVCVSLFAGVSGLCLGCVSLFAGVSGLCLGCVWVVSVLCLSCVYVVSGLCQGCVSVLFGLCKTLQIAVPEVFQGVAGTVLDVFHLFPICQVIRQTADTGHHGLMASPPALCTSGPEPYAR